MAAAVAAELELEAAGPVECGGAVEVVLQHDDEAAVAGRQRVQRRAARLAAQRPEAEAAAVDYAAPVQVRAVAGQRAVVGVGVLRAVGVDGSLPARLAQADEPEAQVVSPAAVLHGVADLPVVKVHAAGGVQAAAEGVVDQGGGEQRGLAEAVAAGDGQRHVLVLHDEGEGGVPLHGAVAGAAPGVGRVAEADAAAVGGREVGEAEGEQVVVVDGEGAAGHRAAGRVLHAVVVHEVAALTALRAADAAAGQRVVELHRAVGREEDGRLEHAPPGEGEGQLDLEVGRFVGAERQPGHVVAAQVGHGRAVAGHHVVGEDGGERRGRSSAGAGRTAALHDGIEGEEKQQGQQLAQRKTAPAWWTPKERPRPTSVAG